MDTLAGMTRTGVKVSGPASDLVELENDKGLKHLAITFHRRYRQHEALNADFAAVRGFLEQPDCVEVIGVADHVAESGAFVYASGSVTPMATVLDTLARIGEPGGVKAGLELCYFVAQVLDEIGEKGERHGVVTHGDLSPWRIALKTDGQVRLLGYGLPQVDILQYLDDGRTNPKEDGYRYAPPERIEGNEEDSSSDLFSLALVAFELMVGEPLYNGVLSEIKQQATNAQGPYRLYAWRERLPEPVIDLLSRALKYDMDSRHADTNEFIWEVRDLLALPSIEGPSLAEVVGKVKHRLRRRSALQGGQTGAMTPEELAEIAEELDGPKRRGLKEPRGARPGTEPEVDETQRWGSVTRSGSRDVRRGKREDVKDSKKDRLRDRLKRSRGREDLRKSGASKSGSDARKSLKDRLKRSRGREDGPRRSSAGRSSAARSSRRDEAPERRSGRGRSRDEKPDMKKSRGSSLLDRLRSSKSSSKTGSEGSADAPASEGPTVSVRVDGGATRSVSVPSDAPICVAIARALEARGGVPTSLLGTPEGWYRAEQDGEVLDGATPVSDLDDGVLDAVFVKGALRSVSVSVEGDAPASFRSPVHTAVSAGAALDQILVALELDGEDWQISVGGRALPPLLPLGDALASASEDDVTLVVKP